MWQLPSLKQRGLYWDFHRSRLQYKRLWQLVRNRCLRAGWRKQAVTSPLLETTIEGASHVIINISGDISLIEANEAASYVQELAGDNANIIFGAMYDESVTDQATITVIATGLEDGNVNKAMAGFAGMAQATRPTVNVKPQYTYSQPAARTSSASNDAPLPGLKQPSPVTPQVKDRGITIPTFLQKNKK